VTEAVTRVTGLGLVVGYAGLLSWLFTAQPKTVAEAIGGVSANLGTYAVDAQAFQDGLTFFRNDQFAEALAAFARADPARREARTQFYIAYSFYRQGWHRTHRDDALYREGIAATDRAIALAPGGRLIVDDPTLQMHSADELRAELEAGLQRSLSDLNPLRVFETRK
jgi:hypothetical protein